MSQIGKLRHRVSLQAPALPRDQNSFGEPRHNASEVVMRWAEVEALSGRELISAQQIVAEVTHRIRLRWLPVFKHYEIGFQAKKFRVEAALDKDGRRVMVELLCRELT